MSDIKRKTKEYQSFGDSAGDDVRPDPNNDIRINAKSHPFTSRESGSKTIPRKLEPEFIFWFGLFFVTGFICGGLIIAAFFRSRDW